MKIASAALPSLSALPSLASASGGMPAGRPISKHRGLGNRCLVFMLMALLLLATSLPALASDGDTWTTKASMATEKNYLVAGLVDGKIYAIGGCNGNGHAINSLEEYDPASNTWTTKASMATARFWNKAVVVGGKIYAIGGYYSKSGEPYTYLNSVEMYDPAANTWTTKTSMATARGHFAVAVVDGKIYAIGGYDGTNRLNSVEEYDPAANSWTTKASMTTAREYHEVAVVDGKIYAIGGKDSTNRLNSVEEYDPAANSWITKAPWQMQDQSMKQQ